MDPERHRPRRPQLAEPVFQVTAGPADKRSSGLLTERWRAEGNVYLSTPLLHAEGRLILSVGHTVTVLDARTGTTMWTNDCGRPMCVGTAPGVLLFAGSHPGVFVVSLDDGLIRGERHFDGESYTPPLVFGDGLAAVARSNGVR